MATARKAAKKKAAKKKETGEFTIRLPARVVRIIEQVAELADADVSTVVGVLTALSVVTSDRKP